MKSEKQLFDEEYAEELKQNPGISPKDFAKKYGLDLPPEYQKGADTATMSTTQGISGIGKNFGGGGSSGGAGVSRSVSGGRTAGTYQTGDSRNKPQLGGTSIKDPFQLPYTKTWTSPRGEEKPNRGSEISMEERLANREMEHSRELGTEYVKLDLDKILGAPYQKAKEAQASQKVIEKNNIEKANAYHNRLQAKEDAFWDGYREKTPAEKAVEYLFPGEAEKQARAMEYLKDSHFNQKVYDERLNIDEEKTRKKLNFDQMRNMMVSSMANRQSQDNQKAQAKQKKEEHEAADAAYRASLGEMFEGTMPDFMNVNIKNAEQYLNEDFKQGIKDNFGTYENLINTAAREDDEKSEMAKYYRNALYSVARTANPALNFLYSGLNSFLEGAPDAIGYVNNKEGRAEKGYPKASDYTYSEIRRMANPVVSGVGSAIGDIANVAVIRSAGALAPAATALDNAVENISDYKMDEKNGWEASRDTVTGTLFDLGTGKVLDTVGGSLKIGEALAPEQLERALIGRDVLGKWALESPKKRTQKNVGAAIDWAGETIKEDFSLPQRKSGAELLRTKALQEQESKEVTDRQFREKAEAYNQRVNQSKKNEGEAPLSELDKGMYTRDQLTELYGVLEQELEKLRNSPAFQMTGRKEQRMLEEQRRNQVLTSFQRFVEGQR